MWLSPGLSAYAEDPEGAGRALEELVEFGKKKHYDGDVKELDLDFIVTKESLGKRDIIELKPRGKDVYVANENKLQYVHAIADYKLNRQVYDWLHRSKFLAFISQLMWFQRHLQECGVELLSGGKHDIDVDDLITHRYIGGYTEGSWTVKIFWEVQEMGFFDI
ncbi:E3 ubiquitin-protein ligase upl7 [Sarracenia purpurea var. burkii]